MLRACRPPPTTRQQAGAHLRLCAKRNPIVRRAQRRTQAESRLVQAPLQGAEHRQAVRQPEGQKPQRRLGLSQRQEQPSREDGASLSQFPVELVEPSIGFVPELSLKSSSQFQATQAERGLARD